MIKQLSRKTSLSTRNKRFFPSRTPSGLTVFHLLCTCTLYVMWKRYLVSYHQQMETCIFHIFKCSLNYINMRYKSKLIPYHFSLFACEFNASERLVSRKVGLWYRLVFFLGKVQTTSPPRMIKQVYSISVFCDLAYDSHRDQSPPLMQQCQFSLPLFFYYVSVLT